MHTFTVYTYSYGITLLQQLGNFFEKMILKNYPSCAPEFAYDDALYDEVSRIIGQILSVVPCYHLACLPDREAALLSCQTLFPCEG